MHRKIRFWSSLCILNSWNTFSSLGRLLLCFHFLNFENLHRCIFKYNLPWRKLQVPYKLKLEPDIVLANMHNLLTRHRFLRKLGEQLDEAIIRFYSRNPELKFQFFQSRDITVVCFNLKKLHHRFPINETWS